MEEEKEEPLPEIPLDQTKVRNDGVDWFNVAKEKGAYIEAENGATGTGIFARCKDTTNEDTQLLDLSVDADELIATSNATLNTNPKFPQAWYDVKGLTNPFKDDKKWDE